MEHSNIALGKKTGVQVDFVYSSDSDSEDYYDSKGDATDVLDEGALASGEPTHCVHPGLDHEDPRDLSNEESTKSSHEMNCVLVNGTNERNAMVLSDDASTEGTIEYAQRFCDYLTCVSEKSSSEIPPTLIELDDYKIVETPGIRYISTCKLEGVEMSALLDSGSERTLISDSAYSQVRKLKEIELKPDRVSENGVSVANGATVQGMGGAPMTIEIDNIPVRLWVSVIPGLSVQIILDTDYWRKARIHVLAGRDMWKLSDSD